MDLHQGTQLVYSEAVYSQRLFENEASIPTLSGRGDGGKPGLGTCCRMHDCGGGIERNLIKVADARNVLWNLGANECVGFHHPNSPTEDRAANGEACGLLNALCVKSETRPPSTKDKAIHLAQAAG